MYSMQKRTVREFNEGLYRKKPPQNTDTGAQQLFTFSKVPSHISSHLKSPLESAERKQAKNGFERSEWFGQNLNSLEFAFNSCISKARAIRMSPDLSLDKTLRKQNQDIQTGKYLSGTFVEYNGKLIQQIQMGGTTNSEECSDQEIEPLDQSECFFSSKYHQDNENCNDYEDFSENEKTTGDYVYFSSLEECGEVKKTASLDLTGRLQTKEQNKAVNTGFASFGLKILSEGDASTKIRKFPAKQSSCNPKKADNCDHTRQKPHYD